MGLGVGVHATGNAARHLRWSVSSLSEAEGWRAPAGRRTWEPRPLAQPGRSNRQRRWVPGAGPGLHVVLETARTASADSEASPRPRPLTLRPHQPKTTQARPVAEKQGQKHSSTSSL